MNEHVTEQSKSRNQGFRVGGPTAGLDVGDCGSTVCILDVDGEIAERAKIRTTVQGVRDYFERRPPMRVALEVGTHSPWISRLLEELGHEVLVANARKLRFIYENEMKDDGIDAEVLARVARLDPKLLAPIQHRGAETQSMLAIIRARDSVVRARTLLINHVRGAVKSFGSRLPKCSAASFFRHAEEIPEELRPALASMMELIGQMTLQVKEFDRAIEAACTEVHPETTPMRGVGGVGPVTSLAYVLTLEDPSRFASARSVGPYIGLAPGRSQSGRADPQQGITKTGDPYLRRLLIGSANYLLGPFGPDTDLRRWGLRLAARGGKNAKKRATVAVARKLSVLLYRLWASGEPYEPLRQAKREAAATR